MALSVRVLCKCGNMAAICDHINDLSDHNYFEGVLFCTKTRLAAVSRSQGHQRPIVEIQQDIRIIFAV